MKLMSIVILTISFILTTASPQMKFIDDSEKGTLTITDGQANIVRLQVVSDLCANILSYSYRNSYYT